MYEEINMYLVLQYLYRRNKINVLYSSILYIPYSLTPIYFSIPLLSAEGLESKTFFILNFLLIEFILISRWKVIKNFIPAP